MLVLAATIGPADATKNLHDWADRFGLSWPQWLTASLGLRIFLIVAAVYYAFLFRRRLRQFPRRFVAAYRAFRTPPPVAPAVEPISPQEVVAIEAIRASVRLAGGPAAERILSLYQSVRASDVKKITFVWLVDKEHSRLREAKNKMIGLIDQSSERLPVLQRALQDFLSAYEIVVRAVHDFEREGVDLMGKNHVDEYARWEPLHADWMHRLDTIKEQPPLAFIGPAMKEIYSGTDLRYFTLFSRGGTLLESASPDERAFLELFCSEASINPKNMIEYSTYSAGLQLGESKLLKVTNIGDRAHRFCLPEAVRRGWSMHGSGPRPQRECFDVHPGSVRMNLNTGGGTPYFDQGPSNQ